MGLKKKDEVYVWVRSGGRCAYPGCNEPLWRDGHTMAEMNKAYLAHIVATTEGGPRGDEILSPKLDGKPSNYLLLCDAHHRLIDVEDIEGHPVELLREYKRLHEQRVERLTSISDDFGTHIVLFGTRIADHEGLVSHKQAKQAVTSERFPDTQHGFRIDLNSSGITDRDAVYWDAVTRSIDNKVESWNVQDSQIEHLSVFALAPIPALIWLGRKLGDTIPVDVYQRHRDTEDWAWPGDVDDDLQYTVDQPSDKGIGSRTAEDDPDDNKGGGVKVAVRLSLSGTVHREEVAEALDYLPPIYTITIDRPRRDFLKTKMQLERFAQLWRSLLAEIRGAYGANVEIHLFPAVPNSIAVEIGRAQLPKSDPPLHVYDHDKDKVGFSHALTIQ